VTTWIEDYGSSLNFKRRGLRRLVTMIVTSRVRKIIVAHKDRLARFGFELIQFLCDMNDCELIVVNGDKFSPEQEMIQDVLTILHVFSARLYGLRSYKKKIQDALKNDQSTQDPVESNP
jgi:predicted site-specific integrase-resolvase